MLNRVGNGAAVAALPLAAAIAGHSTGCMIVAAVFGSLALVVMLITCAPWIPLVRRALPSVRRTTRIEHLLFTGSKLATRPVASDDELQAWDAEWQRWQEGVKAELSAWDAQRVIHTDVVSYLIPGSFNDVHDRSRNALRHQVRALETVLEREPGWARSR